MSSGTVFTGIDRIDDQDERALRHQRQRDQFGGRIERQVFVERHVDRHRRRCRHQQRVAVRRGFRDRVRSDVGAGARTVLDHDRFAEPFLQLLAEQARQECRSRPPGVNGTTMVSGRAG